MTSATRKRSGALLIFALAVVLRVGLFPFAETMAALNPQRQACFIEYIEAAEIQCLPVNFFSPP